MSLLLNVPPTEKAYAMSLGVLWDQVAQTCYLPEGQYDRLTAVEQWIPEKHPAIILPSEITTVHAVAACPKCQRDNRVVALAGNYFFEKDVNDRDEAVWLAQDFFTLFQQVSALSDNLRVFLEEYYPHFKQSWSDTAEGHFWYNHCEHCQHIQDDWFLFEEAGSIFHPVEKEAAGKLRLRHFTLKYAPIIDAVYSLGDQLRLINEFAERIPAAE